MNSGSSTNSFTAAIVLSETRSFLKLVMSDLKLYDWIYFVTENQSVLYPSKVITACMTFYISDGGFLELWYFCRSFYMVLRDWFANWTAASGCASLFSMLALPSLTSCSNWAVDSWKVFIYCSSSFAFSFFSRICSSKRFWPVGSED